MPTAELETFVRRVRGHGHGPQRRVLVVDDEGAASELTGAGFLVERVARADLAHLPEHGLDGIWLGRAEDVDFQAAARALHHGLLRVPLDGDRARSLELELALERADFNVTDRLDGLIAWTKLVTPRIGTCAVVLDAQRRILLCERADGRGWCLPGGYSDPLEAPQITAVREVREETGLEVEVERLLGVYAVTQRTGSKIVACAFFGRVFSGSLLTSDETTDLRWFDESELPERLFSTHRQRVADAFAFLRDPTLPPFVRDGVEET